MMVLKSYMTLFCFITFVNHVMLFDMLGLCLMSFTCSELLGQCSSKVIVAYLESPDSKVKDLAKSELQPLIDSGILKIPDHKAAEKKK